MARLLLITKSYMILELKFHFTEKANFLNMTFASQCTSIVNDSILQSASTYRTENRLSLISFKDKDEESHLI